MPAKLDLLLRLYDDLVRERNAEAKEVPVSPLEEAATLEIEQTGARVDKLVTEEFCPEPYEPNVVAGTSRYDYAGVDFTDSPSHRRQFAKSPTDIAAAEIGRPDQEVDALIRSWAVETGNAGSDKAHSEPVLRESSADQQRLNFGAASIAT
jgi:hypothetical protein